MPVIFVVNSDGRAVAHPDARVAFAERSMMDLKVVQEWSATGRQVKSALAPFNAERDGEEVRMLGAYATARLDEAAPLGVIAIQDEHAALQSVDRHAPADALHQSARGHLRAAHRLPLRQAAHASRQGAGRRRTPHRGRRLLAAHQRAEPHRAGRPRRVVQPDDRPGRELHRRPAPRGRGEPPALHRHGQGARRRHRRQRPLHARPLGARRALLARHRRAA